jgi:hypothetical protein
MFFLPYFSTTLGPKQYKIQNIFDPDAYNIPYVHFGALGVF